MAHLDLEEQEQLDQFKHFWNRYGGLISWGLLMVVAVYAGYNGWQYWQNRKAVQATALYDEVERMASSGDAARLDRALADMKERYAGTTQADQAGLLAAAAHSAAGRQDAARAALQWVTQQASDEGYRAIARLRLAGLMMDAKSYDDALQQLKDQAPAEFAPLFADRRGDIFLAQGKKTEAIAEYQRAWQGLPPAGNYRQVVEYKLTALGQAPAGDKK